MPRALRALHSRLFAKREIAACASLYHLLQNCGLCVSKLMGIEQVKPVMRTLLGPAVLIVLRCMLEESRGYLDVEISRKVNERVDYKILHAELQSRMDKENDRASHLEVALSKKEEALDDAMQ
eukprot:1117776-Pelagomonas_calceolata.AAC.1